MTDSYDIIVIGAGHNGLTAAAYLARAGRKVLVLERRSIAGGAAVTESFPEAPGFRFSSLADGAGRLLPRVVRELELARHGLEILPADPGAVALLPDGARLELWRDPARTAEGLKRFSPRDAQRYPRFVQRVERAAELVAGLMTVIPPRLPDPPVRDLWELRSLLGPIRRLGLRQLQEVLRLLPMSIADLVDEEFEEDALKGVLAARGISGSGWGPRAAGTAYTFLYASAFREAFAAAGVVRGGMGALTQALADSARARGALIRTQAPVRRIRVQAGRAAGVELESGEFIPARQVVSNADPRTTFLSLLEPAALEADFVGGVRAIKYRGSGARVHLALRGLPRFPALADTPDRLRSPLIVAPGVDDLERAADAAKYGGFSAQPYLEVLVPSLSDPSLAPSGQHVMSVYMQYAPYHLRAGDWEGQRQALGDAVVAALAAHAPDLPGLILGRRVITPLDLETIYGLPEGSPHHGEMSLDQFLYMRPVPGWAQYRAPLPGLYLCGAGTHPGGGVTGANGFNAARAVLADV